MVTKDRGKIMELYNEEEQKNTKRSKLPMILGICIGILVVILFVILGFIIYLRGSMTTIKIDDVKTGELEQIFKFDETGTKIYIPIRKIAQYFNYEDYSGDYKVKSEDTTKCYVSNENEIAMFTLDSDVIIKTRGGADYEYVKIDEKVFQEKSSSGHSLRARRLACRGGSLQRVVRFGCAARAKGRCRV